VATPLEKRNSPEVLKDIWTKIGAKWGEFLLKDGKLEELFEKATLKDMGVFGGITTEKILLLSGQPTQIFGHNEHQRMDDLAGALLKEVERRKQLKALGVVEAQVVKA
jgi:hypothetical protein